MSISDNIQQHIFDLLNKASNVSFVSAERLDAPALGLAPGQIVTAEVVSLLPYNRAQVSIGTARLNLELPMTVKVGQSLELTYIADDPRPTFAMPRPGDPSPPVRLSDASRLLGLLLGSNQISDPQVRASLVSVSQLLHQTDGESGLLASVLDEALTYSPQRASTPGGTPSPLPGSTPAPPSSDQSGRATFEANASQILQQVARNARFILVEAASQPVVPLPLLPGEEVSAAVTGTLPGGRTFVQIAGTSLEITLPHAVPNDGILRLTYLSSTPKPLFALQRSLPELAPGSLSEASRWLSVLEHSQGGISSQQMNVLERLSRVITSLPADSPAFSAIRDEALTYDSLRRRPVMDNAAAAMQTQQQAAQAGNGIVLHDDMAKLLQALIKGNRLAMLEAINQQAMPTGLMPGQQVRGEVLATLGGGRFMLDVAGKAMEFTLPKGITTGDRLQLFFIAADPRPTFLLARFGSAGDSQVSPTGRWLGTLLETPGEQSMTAKSAGILSMILGEAPSDPGQVSQMLQKALRESGLFYESHLTRWFGGDYPLEDILREPQGKLSTLKHLMTLNQTEEPAHPVMEQVLAESLPRRGNMLHGSEGMADPRTMPLVQDQLATLQSGQLFFRGELFPGQQMEWMVHERDPRRHRDGAQDQTWDTTLALALPRLGSVSVKVSLTGMGVSLEIATDHAATATTLDNGKNRLVEQLDAAGLTAREIRVQHEHT